MLGVAVHGCVRYKSAVLPQFCPGHLTKQPAKTSTELTAQSTPVLQSKGAAPPAGFSPSSPREQPHADLHLVLQAKWHFSPSLSLASAILCSAKPLSFPPCPGNGHESCRSPSLVPCTCTEDNLTGRGQGQGIAQSQQWLLSMRTATSGYVQGVCQSTCCMLSLLVFII